MNKTQLQQAIFERCLADAAFREAIAANPAAAISSAFGVVFPSGTSVHVHTESSEAVHFLIPAASSAVDDARLDEVVGGIRGAVRPGPTWTSSGPFDTICV